MRRKFLYEAVLIVFALGVLVPDVLGSMVDWSVTMCGISYRCGSIPTNECYFEAGVTPISSDTLDPTDRLWSDPGEVFFFAELDGSWVDRDMRRPLTPFEEKDWAISFFTNIPQSRSFISWDEGDLEDVPVGYQLTLYIDAPYSSHVVDMRTTTSVDFTTGGDQGETTYVTLRAFAPEPGTLCLLTMGGLALLRRR